MDEAPRIDGLYGLYEQGDAAQQAVDHLRAAGVPRDRVTVVTPYPMDGFAFFHHESQTTMWWNACGGGLIGLTAASAMLWIGETSWPLDVGGLPVFAWWPNLIIMFELTMLGAILATVTALVVTARLGRRGGLYDPAVSEGFILVGVTNPEPGAVALLERALSTPTPARVCVVQHDVD